MKVIQMFFLPCVVCTVLLLAGCGGGNLTSSVANTSTPTARDTSPAPVPGSCNYKTGGDCTIIVNGVTRKYRLHIPARFQRGTSALVIALHPSSSTGPAFETSSQLDLKADQVGFAVAYPTAMVGKQGHTVWNGYFSATAFSGKPPDDVGFIRAMINNLLVNLKPDSKRIYVTGFSLGALMTHRVGVEVSDLVAAIAPYEYPLYGYGSIVTNHVVPRAAAPVSVLLIQGSHPGLPNICGYRLNGNVLASMDDNLAYWAGTQANDCTAADTQAKFCTGSFSSVTGYGVQTSLNEKTVTSCRQGVTVKAYKLLGGRHVWYPPTTLLNIPPGTALAPYNGHLNLQTGTDLNDLIWDFFASHPKP